jgi:hypothetical protein
MGVNGAFIYIANTLENSLDYNMSPEFVIVSVVRFFAVFIIVDMKLFCVILEMYSVLTGEARVEISRMKGMVGLSRYLRTLQISHMLNHQFFRKYKFIGRDQFNYLIYILTLSFTSPS